MFVVKITLYSTSKYTEGTVSYLTLQFIQQVLQPIDLRAPVLSIFHAHTWRQHNTKSSELPKNKQINLCPSSIVYSNWF